MAITERYCVPGLATGANDGTSEADAWQSLATAAANYAANQRINVKNPGSRDNLGGNVSFATAGAATTPVILRGYTTTIGDGGYYQFTNGRITLTGDQIRVENFDGLDSDGGSVMFQGTGDNTCYYRCRGHADTVASPLFNMSTGGHVLYCYAEHSTTDTTGDILVTVTNGIAYGNFIKVSGSGYTSEVVGIEVSAVLEHNAMATHNIITCNDASALVTTGIELTNTATTQSDGYWCMNNSVYNCGRGIACFDIAAPTTQGTGLVANNIMYNCGVPLLIAHPFPRPYLPCHTNAYNGPSTAPFEMNQINLTADPFTDAASDDFSLNSSSGGGARCRARAITPSNGFLDLGALQA